MKIKSKTLGIAALVLAAVAVGSFGIAALIAFASGGFGFADGPGAGTAVDEAKTFPMEGIRTIRLATSSTDILVVRSPDSKLSVRLHGTVYGAAADVVPTLVTELSAGVLSARVERKKLVW